MIWAGTWDPVSKASWGSPHLGIKGGPRPTPVKKAQLYTVEAKCLPHSTAGIPFFSLGVIKERIHEWWKCMPTCTFYLYNPQMFSFPNQSAIPGVKDGKTESYLYHMCPWGSYITLSVPCFLNGKVRVIANLQIEFSKGLWTEYISIHLNNFWHIANAHQILDLSCSTLIRQAAFLSLMSVNIEIEILEGYCGWLSLLSICVKCSRIFLLPKSFLVKTFLRQN